MSKPPPTSISRISRKHDQITTYSIGIDTGGTYTDAVIVDTGAHTVIASAKALTTKGDLSLGIIQALEQVLSVAGASFDRAAISMVCLSTTLATNALVEGQGASVGVFLVGFDDAMVSRTNIAQYVEGAKIFRLAGGHLYTGKERAPLALDALAAVIEEHAGKFDTYAVTARYATRNIAHERLVQNFIRQKTARPVSASCELSNSLNDPLRALTTTLNARIISLIASLESAVKTSLRRLQIGASIMIVKGDGSIGSAGAAILKPIETILSGPAASVIGAQFLTGLSDFAIADIGGTTSDLATIKDGWPTLVDEGADVGGFHTLIRAVDIQTVGLGGDSEVSITKSGRIKLGRNRVVPISLLASKWPWIEARLAANLNNKRAMWQASQYIILPEGNVYSAALKALSDKDQLFLKQLDSKKPRHFYEVVGGATDRACLSRLVQQGIVQISGVTPSDAAHVLGLQSQWSIGAAEMACELLGRAADRIQGSKAHEQRQKFAQQIVDAVIAKSCKLVINCLSGVNFRDDDDLINAVVQGTGHINNLEISLTPNIDLVAVGGPASVFYPGVGKRLGVEVIIPKGSEVANAIGAAISMVKVRAVVEITYAEDGGYLIHHHGTPEAIKNGTEAIERASTLARDQAKREALRMGSTDTTVEISVKRIDLPGLGTEKSLIAATITADVAGQAAT